jgi:hypothetical protein
MELPLKKWLDVILKIANAQAGKHEPAVSRLRLRLDQLIKGNLPARRLFVRPLPPLGVAVRRNGVRLVSMLGPSNEADLEEVKAEGYLSWIMAEHAETLEGVIYALSADPLGALIRRCDHCQLFFVMRRNHRRAHSFCCEDHRRAFEHAHRDKKTQAAYMRRYRTVRKRLRKRNRV